MRLSNNLNEPKGFGRNGLPPEGCRRPLVAPADLWYSPAPRPPGGRQEEFMKPIASPFAVLIIVALATALAHAADPAPARDEKEIRERLTAYATAKLHALDRRVDGTLVAIPYEKVYLRELQTASQALQEAAALVGSGSLRRYLSLRSKALVEGDFYPSDIAWLEVKDNLLDVVIGPIETYDDALLGLKASYEGAAMVKDVKESRTLDVYKQHLQGMQQALPVEERYRKASVGGGNVLEIVNIVKFSGDFNAGIKTVAASLPNDERVIQGKGARKQIYKNVLEAKFDAF